MFLRNEAYEVIKPVPCSLAAEQYGKCVIRLMKAQFELDESKRQIPDYTGQWDDDDYIGKELQEWNEAAEALYKLLK